MNNWLVLIKICNYHGQISKRTIQILSALKLIKHPDKIFISWIKARLDILGLNLSPETTELSKTTIEHHKAKVLSFTSERHLKCFERHWLNWVKWAKNGLGGAIF